MKAKFIDIHCHPTMKPYGKSFKTTPGINSKNRREKKSVWYQDRPNWLKKMLNLAATLTKYTQSDFTSLYHGGAHIICASLYPIEKGFVLNKLDDNLISDLLTNFVMGIGKKRIDYLQKMQDYFTDLTDTYKYLMQLDNEPIIFPEAECRYKIVSSFQEIENDTDQSEKTIYVILSIEGANVFDTGLQSMEIPVNESKVLENIDTVKGWDKRVFFITLAHHFYNDLCGHAESLNCILRIALNQKFKLDTGFTDFGKQVLHRLLDNTNNRRILIDIKHMSTKSRESYYKILDEEYAGENIPIIVSHGAVNGYGSNNDKRIINTNTSGLFKDVDINFFDDELIRIATSGGIFGIQLDERRVASKPAIRRSRFRLRRGEMLSRRSKLVWNQIQHIAETLDREGKFAWGIQCLGSDFDGLIDPINGFWGAEEMRLLDSYLEKHAYKYLDSTRSRHLKQVNRIDPDEIVERFMYINAYEFFRKYF